MANPIYYDRRKQTSTSTSTGAFTLGAASGPWKNLNTTGAALTVAYCIAHQTASDWEVGMGSVDGPSVTLTRTAGQVFDGSAGTNLTNFSAGTKDVFITPLANYMARINPFICQGRLGLVSGTPGGDATSGSTIYFTPYLGSQIAMPEPIMGVGQWKLMEFTELSYNLAGLTANMPYDIYIWDNNGVLTLVAGVWTNPTTRSLGILYQDGVPMVGAWSNGYRYLGTFYTTAATTTADQPKQRFLWNYYNQLPRRLANAPQTGSWAYTGVLAWRGQNADATKARAVEFVIGLAPIRPVDALAGIYATAPQAGSYVNFGLTLDGTGAPAGADALATVETVLPSSTAPSTTVLQIARYNQIPAIGYHYLQPVESVSNGTAVVTWYDYVASRVTGGITGTIWA